MQEICQKTEVILQYQNGQRFFVLLFQAADFLPGAHLFADASGVVMGNRNQLFSGFQGKVGRVRLVLFMFHCFNRNSGIELGDTFINMTPFRVIANIQAIIYDVKIGRCFT